MLRPEQDDKVGGIPSRRRALDKLSDREIKSFLSRRQTTATGGKKKLSDGGGLYLTRTPAGTAV